MHTHPSETTVANEVRHDSDVCALPLVRRLAAMLDRDPLTLKEGDPLPHGWHPVMFNTPTRQSQLRADGSADLGVPLPDIGLPRLMRRGRPGPCELRGPSPTPAAAPLSQAS